MTRHLNHSNSGFVVDCAASLARARDLTVDETLYVVEAGLAWLVRAPQSLTLATGLYVELAAHLDGVADRIVSERGQDDS